MAYIDLVAVKHDGCEKIYLFQAPRFSHIEKGDRLVVETSAGRSDAVAVGSVSVEDGSPDLDICITLAGAKKPLKRVLAKIREIPLDWEEDENE